MLRAKDMNTKLLDGLEWFLGVYVTSLDSRQLTEVAMNNQQKICVSSDEPMPLAWVASVHPVTLSN